MVLFNRTRVTSARTLQELFPGVKKWKTGPLSQVGISILQELFLEGLVKTAVSHDCSYFPWIAFGFLCFPGICNATQCSAMQCNAMQRTAMQCTAMQCNVMQCNAMQCAVTLCRLQPLGFSLLALGFRLAFRLGHFRLQPLGFSLQALSFSLAS